MSEVRTERDFTTGGEGADFDEFVAVGRLEKDEFGTTRRFVPPDFLQTEDLGVEIDRASEVIDAIASVKKLFYHEKYWSMFSTMFHRLLRAS
jgi:hypothetical protein